MPSRWYVRPFVHLSAPLAALLALTAPAAAQASPASPAAGPRYINPPGLTRPSGYTHVVVSSDGRTAYIAGQVAFDSVGQVVGLGDFRAQAVQVFSNLGRALASVGATFGDVMKTTTYITDVQSLGMLRESRARSSAIRARRSALKRMFSAPTRTADRVVRRTASSCPARG